jgi:hypothetical protein
MTKSAGSAHWNGRSNFELFTARRKKRIAAIWNSVISSGMGICRPGFFMAGDKSTKHRGCHVTTAKASFLIGDEAFIFKQLDLKGA